jgi:hypothetical protein
MARTVVFPSVEGQITTATSRLVRSHMACKTFRRFYGVPAALRRRPLIR